MLAPSQFSFVFSKAIPAGSPTITILARFNDCGRARLGITVPKKKVKLAVQRNRIKRCIRESFRLNAHAFPNIDIIVIAKHGVADLSNAALHKQLSSLWKRMKQRCQ
ncbi:ribonuclease P protein component [Ningiella sp. W23]|uniref:ribonuclease P protein component n=1 Tax=Ningiella sp. W23 TaxID=3023715 RepID=UPI0039F59674